MIFSPDHAERFHGAGSWGEYDDRRKNIMKKVFSAAFAMVLAVSLFAACAEGGDGNGLPPGGSEAAPEPGQSGMTADPAQMKTEAQLREELAALGNTPEAQDTRLALYEELLARDLCQEEDYLELAQLYADTGDAEAQRRVLWWAFRLYPGEEYVQRLQELAVQRTADEEPAAELIASLRQALEEQDAAALRTLIKGDDWREIFQEVPEVYATRTCYTADDLTAQIVSDVYGTEVFLIAMDGECLYGRLNDEGSLIGAAMYAAGAYNGDAEVCWFDAEDALYKKYQAVLRNDVCVDSVSVEYEGITYTGALEEDGSTKEQQQEKVTQAGGVVYAYQEGGNSFLYQEGITKENFRMDCLAMGLPRVEIWEQDKGTGR